MRLFIIPFTILLFVSCAPEGTPVKIKPYDPLKAGVEIIASYDLDKILYYTNVIDYSIHFSLHNEKFYIINNEKIIILNKSNLIKVDEISFSLKSLYWNLDTSYSNHNLDLAVFNNKILFTYYLNFTNTSSKYMLFSIDNLNNNLKKMDVSSDFGLHEFSLRIGYNNKFDWVWLGSKENNKSMINNYSYDITNDSYINKGNWDYTPIWYGDEICIYGDEVWISSGYFSSDGNEPFIEMRDKKNPTVILKKIIVAYLGVLSSPDDILFDGEFLWIIIYKDSKMQLLKLRPL